MTVGQRIAQKRKGLGLSQEALGERLGVSRQAIYKWESDAALPAIEKLVDLSREFSVSIDWLLGEEGGAPERQTLTPEQLRMVEEIVGRYLAAQPAPAPRPQDAPAPEAESETGSAGVRWLKRWGLLWAALAALTIITAVFFNLFAELREIKGRYGALQSTISTVNGDLSRQIDSITSRMESILERQNDLTAEQSTEVIGTDYRAGTITIAVRALPKTYVEGMTAEFVLVSDGQTVTVSGTEEVDHAFTAEICGPMSDDITVSAAFLTGIQRETQQLCQYSYLYAGSLPHAYTHDSAASPQGDGWIATPQVDVFTPSQADADGVGTAGIDLLRLGLFQWKELVAWYQEEEGRYHDGDQMHSFVLEEEIPLDLGVPYCLAVVVVDECGREMVWPGQEIVCSKGQVQSTGATLVTDPAEWDY